MLTSHARGRTGNLLFQWVFARLLASELGYACELPKVPGFEHLPTSIPGQMINDFNSAKPASDDYTDKSIEEIADELMGSPVMCYGFYERASLYIEHKEEIKQFIGLLPGKQERRTVIHIRGHEAAREGYRCPPLNYFRQAVMFVDKFNKIDDISIVTDDPDNDVCMAIAREFKIPVYCRDALFDFEYIRNSAQIILGNSTFSWWAAFLSGHNNVVQAEPLKGWRSRDMPQKCLIVPEWKQLTY